MEHNLKMKRMETNATKDKISVTVREGEKISVK